MARWLEAFATYAVAQPQMVATGTSYFLLILGLLLSSTLLFSYIQVFNLVLDIHTLYYASIFVMLGTQLLQFLCAGPPVWK
jgi:hypothetical protein